MFSFWETVTSSDIPVFSDEDQGKASPVPTVAEISSLTEDLNKQNNTDVPCGSGMPIWCKMDRNPNDQKVGKGVKFNTPDRRLAPSNFRAVQFQPFQDERETAANLGVSFRKMETGETAVARMKRLLDQQRQKQNSSCNTMGANLHSSTAANLCDSANTANEEESYFYDVPIGECTNDSKFDKTGMVNESLEDLQLFIKSSKQYFAPDETLPSVPHAQANKDEKQKQTMPCRAKQCCARNDPNPECQRGNRKALVDHVAQDYEDYKWEDDYVKNEKTAEPELQPCGSNQEFEFFRRKSREYIIDQNENMPPAKSGTSRDMISEPCRSDACCAADITENPLYQPVDRDVSFPRNLHPITNKRSILGYFRQKAHEFGFSGEAQPQIHNDVDPILPAERRDSLNQRRNSTNQDKPLATQDATDLTVSPSESTIASFLAQDIEENHIKTTLSDLLVKRGVPAALLETVTEGEGLPFTTVPKDTAVQSTQCVSGICPDEPRCIRRITSDERCPSKLSTITQESRGNQPCKMFHILNIVVQIFNIVLTLGLLGTAGYTVALYWQVATLAQEVMQELNEWHSAQQS
uniref:uncharacterized protein LOC101243137 n=1 Tax=Ciona intestinalis TaxID=7719 RepID=UPI000521BAF6|nr:uncharacterized protein LOC101243137 [Ciona intestinalis]|eukprot:XP_004225564.2 uncharacterized protein LOC101243137 [Ciona intestinalis]